MNTKEEISQWFKSLQDSICKTLEDVDGKGKFQEDLWEREDGGGGRSRVLQMGNVIEKGGVNFSAVHGTLPKKIASALGIDESNFFATGLSIVIHPLSPMVPIIHMNVRYFETSSEDGNKSEDKTKSWFGGGIDLTPHYINREDASFFHGYIKNVCDKFQPDYYTIFKKWADDYFYIKHRQETRGIGGIFFDRLSRTENISMEERFEFVKAVAESFSPLYTSLIRKNKDLPFGPQEKQWQLLRRGRYVEFNLVYDKGTKFGLDTDGRTESILMSLPQNASWQYNYKTQKNSEEEKTQLLLVKGINWI